MNAAHTPGPWSWVEVGDTGGDNPVPVYEVIAGNYERGAVRIAEHIADGDAQLIAAAPMMYDALKQIAEAGTIYPPGWKTFTAEQRLQFPPVRSEEAKIAIAFLAKAKGE